LTRTASDIQTGEDTRSYARHLRAWCTEQQLRPHDPP
jgi:hypothetical protein